MALGRTPRRLDVATLILASALITLDGTAVTIVLPAIARELDLSVSGLQWVSNMPLLMMAALLLPGGVIADRVGRARVIRAGLTVFAIASAACALAVSDLMLIGGRVVQGVGAAVILPSALAALRAAFAEGPERTRRFGVWAAWTGVAAAAGPLVGGALADLWSWRAVFAVSAITAATAALLTTNAHFADGSARKVPVPFAATIALVVLLGAVAFALIQGPTNGWGVATLLVPATIAVVAAAILRRTPHRHVLLPRELSSSRNCLVANAATFAFYFGLFGVSFLVALYAQQQLDYSATRAALALLPVSLLMLLAGRFGRLTSILGTRQVVVGGALLSSAGLLWMALAPHPLAFWWHLVVGTTLFGAGLSLAVAALTEAAVAAVPEAYAGAASGLNHATVRAAGLIAIALLGTLAAPGDAAAITAEGFQRALLLCSAAVGLGGVGSGLRLKNEAPGGLQQAA